MNCVIVGMNNPLSMRPELALWPDPAGCTGWHLWRMLHRRCGASKRDYVRAFDRTNLVIGPWSSSAARERAGVMAKELRGRTAIVLGLEVARAFRLPRLLIHPQEIDGVVWRQVPHPSGRNHWYNNADNRAMVELLLEEMYIESSARSECV